LIGLWVRIVKIPYALLFPFILLFCLFGAYTLNNNSAEVLIMLVFGVLGYLNRKVGLEGAPFILALVLGPMMERCLRQSLLISQGDPLIFISRPISGIIILVAFASLFFAITPAFKKKKEESIEPKEEK